jgi:endonuclease/exonuclease/phosphatase family metal-dependent hydrolase
MTTGRSSREVQDLLFAVCLLLAGCRTGRNYAEVAGPRYTGGPPAVADDGAAVRTVRVVSFNIERALRVDAAIAAMRADPETRGADVILLQEMDEPGTRRVAAAFAMTYVYYPGTFSLKARRDFGNAVLSRWPIVGDSKVLLPHLGVFGRLQRTATAATIRIGGSLVRVYSTHLGTLVNVTPAAQRAQLRAVLADAEGHPQVVIGGDMNSHAVGRVARGRGYAWPTEHGPRTTRFGRWDHIFFRGLAIPDRAGAGTLLDVRGASDHRAVWAVGTLR